MKRPLSAYEWVWVIIAAVAVPLVALMIWDSRPTWKGVTKGLRAVKDGLTPRLASVGGAEDSPAMDAINVCRAFKATGLFTECDVSGLRSQIDARLDTSPAEAWKMCPGIVDAIGQKTKSLAKGGWELRLFSPYSGDHPIAVYSFR